MKKGKTLLGILILAVILCLTLAACGPFEGFDDDNDIINHTGNSTVGSEITNTSSKYSFSAKKFNGVIRVKDITLEANPTLDLTVTITSGKFKVVLVKDKKVYVVTDKAAGSSVTMTDLPAGTYNLRIVGKDAECSFVFNF